MNKHRDLLSDYRISAPRTRSFDKHTFTSRTLKR